MKYEELGIKEGKVKHLHSRREGSTGERIKLEKSRVYTMKVTH